MYAVGIDLGTTNSAVAVLKGRPVIIEDSVGNRTVPSAVGWDADLEEFMIGIDAKNNPEVYKTVLSVKRKMGTEERIQIGPRSMLPEEVSAEILKALKRQAEQKLGGEVTEAIITVPAHFQMASKAATERAGKLAGLKLQQLLEEPSAAIMAYGPQQDEKILVYDLGGGTFDVTIIDCFAGALTTKAVFGNNFLGGDDFDRRLMDYLRELLKKNNGLTIDEKTDAAAMSVLKKAAETAKIEMSRKSGARINIPKVKEVQGRPVGIETVIKTSDFNAMIKDLIDGTLVEVEKALNHAKLDKSDIDTVLLVGGSTYYPLVQETVRKFFGKEPNKSLNPDLAVAMGAAASLVADKPPEGGRHVVTVGFVPEKTPEETVEIRGRTTPGSQVRLSGAAAPVTAEADEEGEYTVQVPLKKGINTFVITAIAPSGEKATIDPEPILQDAQAVVHEEPPAPPAPILPRALSVSCGLQLGLDRSIPDYAAVIMAAQSELPKQATSDGFATSQNNQPALAAVILEGDLPVASLNTKLADISLQLPPNVPANERVCVHFTVDENSTLTAELEVPSLNRRGKVVVNLKSPSNQLHLFQQVENLYTQVGGRIRPEQRAAIEQSRVAIEDLSREFANAKAQGDSDGIFNGYNRIVAEAQKLRAKMDEARRLYA